MQLDSAFDVTAPIDKVWATLMDFERVASCLPGAQVLQVLSEDAYQVGMKVKLGPVTMQYKGQLEVVERKPEVHSAVLKGRAKEARGQGTAEATANLALSTDGAVTHGTVSADVALSGRAAAMGQSVINSVTEQMMAQFAINLQAMLSEDGPLDDPLEDLAAGPVGGVDPVVDPELLTSPVTDPVEGSPLPSLAPEPDGAPLGAVPSHRAPNRSPAPENALDGLALARGIAEAQLREPRKVLGALALVGVVAYLLGRRRRRPIMITLLHHDGDTHAV